MNPHRSSLTVPFPPRQRGAALLVLFLVLGIAAATLLVTALTRQSARIENDTQTVDALAQAREALIGYAATTDPNTVLGYLPTPDMGPAISTGGEGTEAPGFAGNNADLNLIGRLPWRALGLPPLRDGSGECLWYAVSGHFKHTPATTGSLNWDTPGQFDLKAEDGVTTLAPNVVAVVFGPGPVISGQNRAILPAGAATCGGNYDAAAYLDTPAAANAVGGILNYYPGTTNNGVAPTAVNKPLVTQANGNAYNDRMLAITTDDIFRSIMQRSDFKKNVDDLLSGLKNCLNAQSTAPAASGSKGADALNTCGAALTPTSLQSFYTNWKDNLLYAKLPTPTKIAIDGVQTSQACSAVVIFGGRRVDDAHARWTAAAKNLAANYLEGVNASSFPNGTAYSGWGAFDKNNPSRDLIACITPTAAASQKLDFSNIGADFKLVTQNFSNGRAMMKDNGNHSLQLGGGLSASISAQCTANSNLCRRNLYGCAWSKQAYSFGSGFRAYFKFTLQSGAGDGFTFAIADADQNTDPGMCGAAAEDMGYSGWNLVTPNVKPPKLALELDMTRNTGPFSNANCTLPWTCTTGTTRGWGYYYDGGTRFTSITRTGGNTFSFVGPTSAAYSALYDILQMSRNGITTYYLSNVSVTASNRFTARVYTDAAHTVPYTGTLNRSATPYLLYKLPYGFYNNARNDPNANHAALDYWGYSRSLTNPAISHPDSEDNVHNLGFTTQSTANPDPWNPYRSTPNPSQVPGMATVSSIRTRNLAHHVRIEAKRLNDYDGTKRSYQLKIWVFNNNDANLNTAGELAAFKNTALDYGNITGNGFTGISNNGNTFTFTDTSANFAHRYTVLSVGGATYYLNTTTTPNGNSFTSRLYTDAAHTTAYTGAIPTNSAYQLQFTPPTPTLSPNGYVPLVVYDLTVGQEALKNIRIGFTAGSGSAQTINLSDFVLETLP